jgi:uncharacterized protein (TIGR03663 family)
MALVCTQCNADNPKTNRFCDTCGAKLPKADEAAPPKAAPKPKAAEASARPRPASAEAEAALPSLAGGGQGISIDQNMVWLLVILGIGAFLRLFELGLKPLHHDESIHAWYAYNLFKGQSYKYDPAYHGPFRYHITALMFFIFGDSDATCRLFPAMVGIFIIAFMWQWRGFLGAKGALFTAAFMAVSPTFTYVSRFIRDDIFMALGSLGMVWGLFKWFESRQNKYLYWMTAGLCMAFTSHEGTWIFMGIFGTFLFFRWLWETLANPVDEEKELSDLFAQLKLVDGAPAWVNAAVGIFPPFTVLALIAGGLGFVKLRPGWKTWAVMLTIFFVPFTLLYSTFFSNMDGWFMGAFDSIAYWLGEQKTGRADQPWQFYIYMLALYELAIVVFAMIGGLRVIIGSGKPNYVWMKLTAWIPFAAAIVILNIFPKNPHAVLPMAALATLGSGMVAFSTFAPEKGNHFKVFLVYWALLAYVMFTIAGERMPWLTLHPLTPLTLLAGMYLGEFFDREKPLLGEHWIAWSVLWLLISFFVVLGLRQVFQVPVQAWRELASWFGDYMRGDRHGSYASSGLPNNAWQSVWSVVPWFLFVPLVAATPFLLERRPKLKNLTRGTFVGLFILALATLLHGTTDLLFHGDGADPREQHVYVQSAIELPELAAKLDRMSRGVTGGPYLKVAVEDLCSWPLSWYLRNLPNAQIGFGPPMTLDKVKDFPVAITGYDNSGVPNHDQIVADSFKDQYNPYPIRFRRWWAPDRGAFEQGSLSDEAMRAFNLYMYREPWMPATPNQNPQFANYIYPKGDSINSPYGSFDACVWVRKDVDRFFQ